MEHKLVYCGLSSLFSSFSGTSEGRCHQIFKVQGSYFSDLPSLEYSLIVIVVKPHLAFASQAK